MREALRLLLGEEVEKLVVMGLAKDGSEVGGAHSKTFLLSCRLFRSLTFCLSVCLCCTCMSSRARCIASDETQQNCNLRSCRREGTRKTVGQPCTV